MTNTIYIHQPEKAFSFTRLPNFLFEAPTFNPLSNEAKVLYAFILRRTELSRKNGWADEYGRIYLYYPICEVVALLHCGRQKAVNTLRELQYAWQGRFRVLPPFDLVGLHGTQKYRIKSFPSFIFCFSSPSTAPTSSKERGRASIAA